MAMGKSSVLYPSLPDGRKVEIEISVHAMQRTMERFVDRYYILGAALLRAAALAVDGKINVGGSAVLYSERKNCSIVVAVSKAAVASCKVRTTLVTVTSGKKHPHEGEVLFNI